MAPKRRPPRSQRSKEPQAQQPQWIYRNMVPLPAPLTPLPFVYDPYGGLPRREDLDTYNTSMPPPPVAHDNDLQPTFRSFRDLVLSTQSWGAKLPEPTQTSIKRWAYRALKTEDAEPTSPPSPKQPVSPQNEPPKSTSTGDSPPCKPVEDAPDTPHTDGPTEPPS